MFLIMRKRKMKCISLATFPPISEVFISLRAERHKPVIYMTSLVRFRAFYAASLSSSKKKKKRKKTDNKKFAPVFVIIHGTCFARFCLCCRPLNSAIFFFPIAPITTPTYPAPTHQQPRCFLFFILRFMTSL